MSKLITKSSRTVALLGNPNSGKSTLFNTLTGLHQRIGNFPGVTVDKKVGEWRLPNMGKVSIIDFPGCYSLYPNSRDERIVVSTVLDRASQEFPDAVVYVADVNQLERHLLLATQLIDLGLPLVLALNMSDQIDGAALQIDTDYLSHALAVPVVSISGRAGTGIDDLSSAVESLLKDDGVKGDQPIYTMSNDEADRYAQIADILGVEGPYAAKVASHHISWLPHLTEEVRQRVMAVIVDSEYDNLGGQVRETMQRYDVFTPIARRAVAASKAETISLTDKVDAILTHRLVGPVIFLAVLFLVFQAVYSWATGPMDMIDSAFVWLGSTIGDSMPDAWYTDLIVDGLVAGLGGVVIFIPQITILFLLIAVLEEVGYMARAVFMFDGLMQKVGLNGRSIVALVSSGACAIPAIMSTRTISNKRERLITILVSPLISCSARIPVYVVLVAFVVPAGTWGGFDMQGLVFMLLYLLGIVAALVIAFVCKLLMPATSGSQLMMELPQYQRPSLQNIWSTIRQRVTAFVVEAGKVIMIISVVLWFLASYGPSDIVDKAISDAEVYTVEQGMSSEVAEDYIASQKLEASYAGMMGKAIEPVIAPLGFDWKMGIALITSFAAREVFVGTMATIYSIGSTDDEASLRQRMKAEIRPSTGKPMYDMATALSLLIFYVFAMQCMSTLAVTYKETQSWRWPLTQLVYMTALAYLGSLFTYQLLA